MQRSCLHLNLDIIYEIASEAQLFSTRDRQQILSNLALTCHEINKAVRPALFRQVLWPHRKLSKNEKSRILNFFPETIWPYVKEFHLDWPEEWPDESTSMSSNTSYPEMLSKLKEALPEMINLHTFQMTCPFSPPISLLNALVWCEHVKDFRIIDTPLSNLVQLPDPFEFEGMTLVPVAEAMRVGEGPFHRKFREMQYFVRPYRQRNRERANRVAAQEYLFDTGLPKNVKHLQISSQYLRSIDILSAAHWPQLETFILTGSTFTTDLLPMSYVVAQMPRLRDLRLLLSKPFGRLYESAASTILGINPSVIPPMEAFSGIKYLALSNSYKSEDIVRHSSSLERLCITAIMRHPQIPIAMRRADLTTVLENLKDGGGNLSLKRLRLMTEDKLTVELFRELGRVCPNLEVLEVELCGYREEEAGFEWTDYGDVFSTYEHLQELRIGIPFADCDEPCEKHADLKECIRSDRRDCAIYFASRVPTLKNVGFEYRMRTGSHRKEDRWLDYEVIRLRNGDVMVQEIGETWYPFPEVWNRAALYE